MQIFPENGHFIENLYSMEKIYDPNSIYATENFDIEDFFEKCSKACDLSDEKLVEEANNENVAIMKIIDKTLGKGVNLKKIKKLQNDCSPEFLAGEEAIEKPTTKNSELGIEKVPECYKMTPKLLDKLEVLKYKNDLTTKNKVLYLSYKALCGKMYEAKIKLEDDSTKRNLRPGQEVVMYVRIYRPLLFQYDKKNSNINMKYSHEIKLLGTNTLTDLRDAIFCNSDAGICTESDDVFQERSRDTDKAKEKYPSGFIFIDGVFYNDFRNPKAIDYSEVVRKWARDKNIGEFKTESMDKVMLKTLKPRIGYPYVYQHQGDCEHCLVFTDIQLLSHQDSLCSSNYPQYFSINNYICQNCNICGITVARWLCLKSDRLPSEKSFLCNDCFLSYNYIDGKKVGNFKAYPYFDNSSIM